MEKIPEVGATCVVKVWSDKLIMDMQRAIMGDKTTKNNQRYPNDSNKIMAAKTAVNNATVCRSPPLHDTMRWTKKDCTPKESMDWYDEM